MLGASHRSDCASDLRDLVVNDLLRLPLQPAVDVLVDLT